MVVGRVVEGLAEEGRAEEGRAAGVGVVEPGEARAAVREGEPVEEPEEEAGEAPAEAENPEVPGEPAAQGEP